MSIRFLLITYITKNEGHSPFSSDFVKRIDI